MTLHFQDPSEPTALTPGFLDANTQLDKAEECSGMELDRGKG